MRHKILIIDDHYQERSQDYARLARACNDLEYATPPGFEIELFYAKNPWDVDSLLRNNSFSAVILDVVLQDWKWGANAPVRASEMLSKFDDSIPVALLSSEWLSDEVRNIVASWPTKNCRMFIHWAEISEESRIKEEGSLTRVVCELAKYIEAHKNLEYSLALEDDEPIRILHLSDLQFGGFGTWKQKLDASHCATTIRRRKNWTSGPTFIVITGDVAERGLPTEYEAAYVWLKEFVSEFGWVLPSSRVLLVPGNHDVCLPLAASSQLALQETAESKARRQNDSKATKDLRVDFNPTESSATDLRDFAFRPYLDFCGRVTPRSFLAPSRDPDRSESSRHSYAWVESRFRHLGVTFFGLNTAQPIQYRTIAGRSVPKSTIEDIVRETRAVAADLESPPLTIGLTHHYPLRGQKDWAVEEPEHFSQLFTDAPRVALWLHGHWHLRETSIISTARPAGILVVNSAPSLTVSEEKRPADTARGFSMIELVRSGGGIDGCNIMPVEWNGTNGLVIREREGKQFDTDSQGFFVPRPEPEV